MCAQLCGYPCREHPTLLPERVCPTLAQGGHGPGSIQGWHTFCRARTAAGIGERERAAAKCKPSLSACTALLHGSGRICSYNSPNLTLCAPRAAEQELLPGDQHTQLLLRAGSAEHPSPPCIPEWSRVESCGCSPGKGNAPVPKGESDLLPGQVVIGQGGLGLN